MPPIPPVDHVADRSNKSQKNPQTALHFDTLPRYLLSREFRFGSSSA